MFMLIDGNKQVHRAMQTILHLVPSYVYSIPILLYYFIANKVVITLDCYCK